ncbi:MAG: HEAT repeat domain-containing protein [Bryobacteraceae bacterium]
MSKGKKDSLEHELANIRAIRNAPENYDLARDLTPFLQHKSNHAIAAAADAAKDLEAEALVPALSAAFTRLMKSPAESDPGCKALISIASALATLGAEAADAYLSGIRHVQREGSYGPPVDVAAPLRGMCARGLVRMAHHEALLRTIEVLADREIPARVGAVRALSDSGSPAAELALRLKVLQGDDVEVVGECFTALLFIEPERSVEFVAGYLHGQPDQVVESAALALGESRLASAFTPLQAAYAAQARRPLRKTFLLAMAMLRKDEALEFLLTRLEQEPESAASDALAALALYRSDEVIVERARRIVTKRDSALLTRLCNETLR